MYLPIEVSLDWCYNKIASRKLDSKLHGTDVTSSRQNSL